MKNKTSTRIPWYKIDISTLLVANCYDIYNFIQMVLGNVKKSTSISFVPYFNTLRDLNLNNLFLSLASNNKVLWIFVKYVTTNIYTYLTSILLSTTYLSCMKTPNWCLTVWILHRVFPCLSVIVVLVLACRSTFPCVFSPMLPFQYNVKCIDIISKTWLTRLTMGSFFRQ